MNLIEWIFLGFIFLVFYTYLGYGIFLGFLVKVKEFILSKKNKTLPDDLPEVAVLIAAYNEEAVIADKMINCQALDYPSHLLKIYWITDGSTDKTNELLSKYPEITVFFKKERAGKSAAINRAMPFIKTPLTVFTDANTFINPQAIKEIVKEFTDAKVGCVAGEKRVLSHHQQNATAGEGIYWKYESTLKDWDYRLYSAVGAAGELFAIRTFLFISLPDDTLLDDFIMSMKIAQKGYKIAYCKEAYAEEEASFNIIEESKRKVRIAAGGLQSIYRLRSLLLPFVNPILSFQYISHRVLRWSITPVVLFLLIPLNVYLCKDGNYVYIVFMILQIIFYTLAYIGKIQAEREIKNKWLFIPYYFMMMNYNVMLALPYLIKNKGKGIWDKAIRKS